MTGPEPGAARTGRAGWRRLPELRRKVALDAPTAAVAVAVYGGWLAATAWHGRVPDALLFCIGGWLVAWHGSLQHETIHGRLTGASWADEVVGAWPLSLWLPYGRYRDLHLAHHGTEHVAFRVFPPRHRHAPPASNRGERMSTSQSANTRTRGERWRLLGVSR